MTACFWGWRNCARCVRLVKAKPVKLRLMFL